MQSPQYKQFHSKKETRIDSRATKINNGFVKMTKGEYQKRRRNSGRPRKGWNDSSVETG